MSVYSFSLSVLEGVEKPGSDGRIIFTTCEGSGADVQDALNNATVGLEDWLGNDKGQILLSELPGDLYAIVEREVTESRRDAVRREIVI
jgi:hypothetical protein